MLEEAKKDGYPIGRSGVSINLHPWDFSNTEPCTRQHRRAGLRQLTHIQQRNACSDLSERRHA